MGTWQRRQTGHHFVWAIYEVPTHRSTERSRAQQQNRRFVQRFLPHRCQEKVNTRIVVDLNIVGVRFTFSRGFFTRVFHAIPGRISLFRHHSNLLCYQVRLMLPGNASDVVDRLSEKAQRSKSWRSSPRSWTVLQICSSLVVLIHIFFFPLLDRRHLVSKMVSAVANGYEHSVRWRIGLFHINLGKILNCAKIAKFKRRIIIFISC